MSETKIFCDRCGEAWSACRCDMRIDRFAYNSILRTGRAIEKLTHLLELEIFYDLSKHCSRFHTQGKSMEDVSDDLDFLRRNLSLVQDQLDEILSLMTQDC